MYEAHNQRGPLSLTFAYPVAHAEEVNLLEEPLGQVVVEGNQLHLSMRPFEVKTLRVKLAV
jgi:alpha-mannosidase